MSWIVRADKVDLLTLFFITKISRDVKNNDLGITNMAKKQQQLKKRMLLRVINIVQTRSRRSRKLTLAHWLFR